MQRYMCCKGERGPVPGVFMNRPDKPARLLVQAEFQEHTLTWPTCWELFGLPCPGWLTHRNDSPFPFFFFFFWLLL